MTPYEIVKKIIGETRPYGDSSIDRERINNLDETIKLVDALIDDIKEAAKYRDRYESTIKAMAKKADDFLNELKENL